MRRKYDKGRVSRARAGRVLAEFEDAVRADEVKGGGDPDAIGEVEAKLQLARSAIRKLLGLPG